MPSTAQDWKQTVADIKRQHVNKRYRACSTKCNDILERVKDNVSYYRWFQGCNSILGQILIRNTQESC